MNLQDLLKAGVHFGHKTSRWSPKMRPFIWGSKNKVHLIDIAKTAFLMERAGKFLKEIASEGNSILFVGTKKAASKSIQDMAVELNSPFVTNRWIGGTLTNYDQVKKAITRYLHLGDIVARPTEHYKKKELSMIQKEIGRLEKNIGGILKLKYPAGALVVVDAKKEASAIKEAKNAGIPVIALVDTNTDPTGINFVIPANDDSPRSINFILEYLKVFIKDGQKLHADKKNAAKEEKELAKKAREAAKKDSKKTAVETKKATPKVETKAPAKKTEVKKETAAPKAAPKKAETKSVEKKPTTEKKTEVKKTAAKVEAKAPAKKTDAKK